MEKFLNGEWLFEDDFEEFLINKQEINREERSKYIIPDGCYHFYPTQVWRCYLQQFLQYHLNKSPNVTSLKIFYFGDLAQDHLVDKVMVWKYGNLHEVERNMTVVVEPFRIYFRGRIDGLITVPVPNSTVTIPVEVKSQGGGVAYMKNPVLDHVYQILSYMVACNSKIGYLVYVDRSGIPDSDERGIKAVTKTFCVKWNQDVWAELTMRAKFMADFLDKGEIPSPEAILTKNKKKCSYCAYKKECDYLMTNRDVKTWDELKLRIELGEL